MDPSSEASTPFPTHLSQVPTEEQLDSQQRTCPCQGAHVLLACLRLRGCLTINPPPQPPRPHRPLAPPLLIAWVLMPLLS